MAIRLKPVEEQVVVITGASSGIGLATARLFAARGVRGLVLVSRNAETLRQVARAARRREARTRSRWPATRAAGTISNASPASPSRPSAASTPG